MFDVYFGCEIFENSGTHIGAVVVTFISHRLFGQRFSDSTGRLFNLGEMSCFNQHNAQFNEFEYHFACRRKVVHLCFITSPGKMIFAVLEL